MKSSRLLLVIALLALSLSATAKDDPKANPQAMVTAGNVRFTVLTDRLVRMEWSADGKFEDRATLAIVNRNLPVPAFTSSVNGDAVVIKTSALTLAYAGKGKFTEDNLSVTFKLNGKPVTWKPGMADTGNLLGTFRTLDGCGGFMTESAKGDKMDNGVASRDGWAVIDESTRHILAPDDSDWENWIDVRPEGDRQDLYMFAYGHDYVSAISDFTKVGGRIPLPPKYTFGYWWSRYWAYTDQELLDLAQEMRDRQIPIDVFIVDMDWHETWHPLNERTGKDEFGQRRGWTGYTWNGDLFPDPEGFLYDIHRLGYKTALNLHPASGIRPYEECYSRFVADYLSRTDDYDGPKDYIYGKEGWLYAGNTEPKGKEGYRAAVPYRMSQKAFADAYFNSVIHPLEKQGVDFWWLDWQQWKISKYMDNLSNTFWINFAFFQDKVRQSASKGLDADRPFIYHRWGGLGSHRYQLGFSGDTQCEWEVLKFLPYFTATASNVGYGYWGHDIGGHMHKRGNERLTEPEMYTRWLQYGVFTPIFKTHSTNNANLERKIWAFPTHYEYMKAAIDLRYALTPYIYDAARQAYDTGICICRPMYYYYPEDSRAYDLKEQYMFGDKILATALCEPLGANGKTARSMWFPKGTDWYDMAHHETIKGGTEKTLYYSIDENPWYVKAGSVIPLAEEGIQNLQNPSNTLRLLVIPGAGKSTYSHYEDDGMSQAYVKDYTTTLITKEASGNRVKLTVDPRRGSYRNMPETRHFIVVLEGVTKLPAAIRVNGSAVVCACRTAENSISIDLPEYNASEKLVIEVVK